MHGSDNDDEDNHDDNGDDYGEDKFSKLCSLSQLSRKEEIHKTSAKREGSEPPAPPSIKVVVESPS